MPHKRLLAMALGCALCATMASSAVPAQATDPPAVARLGAVIHIVQPDVPLSELPQVLIDDGGIGKGWFRVSVPDDGHTYRVCCSYPNGHTHNFTIPPGWTECLVPLIQYPGDYEVQVIVKNESGKDYTRLLRKSMGLSVRSQVAAALYPTLLADYGHSPAASALAEELSSGRSHDGKINAVWDYVRLHIAYDKEKANALTNEYNPVPDATLAEGKGVCFDYASLVAAMLRSRGVPCRVVVGTYDGGKHAWNEAYTQAGEWVAMDATFGYRADDPAASPDIDAGLYAAEEIF